MFQPLRRDMGSGGFHASGEDARFHTEAHAARWYEQRHAGLGLAFVAAVDRAVESIVRWPQAGGAG